ncbi:MAG: hypothetical protein FJX72_03885 [Armatimonadetes bacterium]|nr:hypothetical protein [Armatimonadota bacterium]
MLSAYACALDTQRWEAVSIGDLRNDARLRRSATVQGPRLFVAEVLEALCDQTGVPISADEASRAGDARLIAWVKDQPAWKTMSALASLFSHKHAPWLWERSGSAKEWRYRLVQTRSAQALSELLQRDAQAAFEEVTGADIARTRRTDQEWTERLADPTPVRIEERAGWGLQVFATCVDPELQLAVLRGQSTVTVPVERLPAFGKRLVEDMHRQMRPYRQLPSGERETPPLPAEVRFYAHARESPTSSLFIRLGYLGAYAYSGGLPLARRFRSDLRDLWVRDEDAASNPQMEALRVKDGVVSRATSRLNYLERCCMQLAELTDIPILARTPLSHGTGTERSPANHVVGEYLGALAEAFGAMHKWHEEFLLISYAAWFEMPEEMHRPPYAVVRRLREAVAGNDGLLTPEAVIDACRDLTPEEMQVLEASLPGFKWLARVRQVVSHVARDRALRATLLSEGRVVLTGPALKSLVPTMNEPVTPGGPPEVLPVERVAKMVLTVQVRTAQQERRLDVWASLYDSAGNLIVVPGVTFTPGAP